MTSRRWRWPLAPTAPAATDGCRGTVRVDARAPRSIRAGVMARQGRLRIFELEVAGQVVGSRIAFFRGRELNIYYSGRDPSWCNYSVTTTRTAKTMRGSFNQNPLEVNVSIGEDQSKLRRSQEIKIFRELTTSRVSEQILCCGHTTGPWRYGGAVVRLRGFRSGAMAHGAEQE